MPDFTQARHNMIDNQLRPNGVTDDRILAAMEVLPRERFVPPRLREVAYIDEDLPLEDGRFLMEPVVLARLLSAAGIGRQDTVLDIACGTGYGSAVIAHLARTVIGIDGDAAAVEAGNAILADLSIDNAVLTADAPEAGCAKHGPFQVILIEGMVDQIPQALIKQLAEDGSILTVQRDAEGIGRAVRLQRHGDGISRRVLFDANTPALPEFRREAGFVF